ncbi:putative membrane protein [Babesia divergens]|uniref:Membrane protein n=1 Tax=Babesia divergens TaxID=32595 RepID=A0AAD9LKN2_BABDI|nr:putative membrane protein [Babesia divergens]
MVPYWLCAGSLLLLVQHAAADLSYEEFYATKLRKQAADEIVDEPLLKLGIGSCQKVDLDLKRVYDSIVRYDPDMFLFTGDVVYAANGCCEPHCLKTVYDKLTSSSAYQQFARSMKRIEAIYDDHDFGINDGDGAFKYKEFSQKYLMDFLNKPHDHYRRRRKGSYFSVLFRDPNNAKNTVKLIVLDVRYHRSCFYYCPCQTCLWKPKHMSLFIYHRLINFILGLGWDHDGDVLGEEQWHWLEGQLHNSEAESHIIVSSMQIFTRYAITESWGLLPRAKDRLVNLMLATKPKNPIFVSGDVHYGEIDVMDGVVEITASSLTHSILELGRSPYRPFPLSVYFIRKNPYMYNNFGGIEYEFDSTKGVLKWEVKLFNADGEVVDTFKNDGTMDPRAVYEDLDKKHKSFFKNTRIVRRRGILFLMALVYLMCCAVSWMVLIPYIIFSYLLNKVTRQHKEKTH